ncbi:MAG: hypothetical protein ABI045_05015 [Flavobacteriales bacterium]
MGYLISKSITEKKKKIRNKSRAIQVKEVVTEPMINYIEVPVDCPENQDKPVTG